MRPIDLYRGIEPPSQRFSTFFNPACREARKNLAEAWEKLKKYGIPHDLLDEIDTRQNELTVVELELMWCFAFKEGMEFQDHLGRGVEHMDIFLPSQE